VRKAGPANSTTRIDLPPLEDAGNCITKLPKAEHAAPELQDAMEVPMLVATRGGPTMLARKSSIKRCTTPSPRSSLASITAIFSFICFGEHSRSR
jgi:hypothetical protein